MFNKHLDGELDLHDINIGDVISLSKDVKCTIISVNISMCTNEYDSPMKCLTGNHIIIKMNINNKIITIRDSNDDGTIFTINDNTYKILGNGYYVKNDSVFFLYRMYKY